MLVRAYRSVKIITWHEGVHVEMKKMNLPFDIKYLEEKDTDIILALYKGNTTYFHYCQPQPSEETVKEDMIVCPGGVPASAKHYVGIFDADELVAVLDLIEGYPDIKTAWIGLFMLDRKWHGRGMGTRIFTALYDCLKQNGFKSIQLGYIKGNPQAEAFWRKNGFSPTGRETVREEYTIIVSEKIID